MVKSRKSNRRTKRVYRRKPRINKKRRLTKRKAGGPCCSPTTAAKCAAAGVALVLTRPKPPKPPRDLGFSTYEGREDPPVAPFVQSMGRPRLTIENPENIGSANSVYINPPTGPRFRR